MTEQAKPGSYERVAPGDFDAADPENIAPLVAWLASPEAAHVTGRVFTARGGRIQVLEGWHGGPMVEKAERWDPAELGQVVSDLVDRAAPNADLSGDIPNGDRWSLAQPGWGIFVTNGRLSSFWHPGVPR